MVDKLKQDLMSMFLPRKEVTPEPQVDMYHSSENNRGDVLFDKLLDSEHGDLRKLMPMQVSSLFDPEGRQEDNLELLQSEVA